MGWGEQKCHPQPGPKYRTKRAGQRQGTHSWQEGGRTLLPERWIITLWKPASWDAQASWGSGRRETGGKFSWAEILQ